VVEKRLWAYLCWLHDLQKIKREKALIVDPYHIESKKVRSFRIMPL
jgi:hypothetical protein